MGEAAEANSVGFLRWPENLIKAGWSLTCHPLLSYELPSTAKLLFKLPLIVASNCMSFSVCPQLEFPATNSCLTRGLSRTPYRPLKIQKVAQCAFSFAEIPSSIKFPDPRSLKSWSRTRKLAEAANPVSYILCRIGWPEKQSKSNITQSKCLCTRIHQLPTFKMRFIRHKSSFSLPD